MPEPLLNPQWSYCCCFYCSICLGEERTGPGKNSFTGAMLMMSMTCAATGGHVYVHGLCCYRRPCWWCHAIGSHVDYVHDLCCHRRPCWCPLSVPPSTWVDDVMPQEAMLMFVIHAVTRDKIVVHNPCCHWKPCESPWSVQLLTDISKEASFAVLLMTSIS